MNHFLDSADSRETSFEIIRAIWEVSGQNEVEANRIWEAPNNDEMTAIFEIVTKNGSLSQGLFFWGWAGNHWLD